MYSTGMLLSLLGRPTPRKAAKALFGLRRRIADYTGADLDVISSVLRRAAALRSARWKYFKTFRFSVITRHLREQLVATGLPTLIWFGAVYGDETTLAFHIAVVLGVHRDRILLLDPLGSSPCRSSPSNAAISAERVTAGEYQLGFLRTERGSYFVDTKMQAAILRWREQ